MSKGVNQIIQGDCLEVMDKLIEDGVIVDVIITDPPYGITACKWDSVIPLKPMWRRLDKLIKPNGVIVMTASQPFTTTLISSNMEMWRHNLVWDKVSPSGHLNARKKPLSRHEDICVFSKSKHGQFTYNPQMRTGKFRNKSPKRSRDNVVGRCYGAVRHKGNNFNDQYYPTSICRFSVGDRLNRVHPTQKPLSLMKYIIMNYSRESEVILDFAMGSGTTCVAAKQLGRKYIGIEIDEKYCDIARQRLSQEILL